MKQLVRILLLLALPGSALATPQVTGIRYWSAPDHTRVVLDMDGEYRYSTSTRQDPHRIVIDIPGAGFACPTGVREVGDSLLVRVRCNLAPQGAQVVLDLDSALRFKHFALEAIPGEKPRRVVVDVYPDPAAQTAVPRAAAPQAPAKAKPLPFQREVVVVIDAGHGGEDPGAIFKGNQEKTITLDIARRLKKELDALPGYRAVLTRDGDYTVSLGRRRELAEVARGDILVSIHCNTAPHDAARGAEIFYLSTAGASSRRAQALADLENRADLVGGAYPQASESEMKLVVDERLKRVVRRSSLLAAMMRDRSKESAGFRARGIKRAAFAICKMVSMPAVLVEVGFLTNDKDRALLCDAVGRQDYAAWLAGSLDAYFTKYPSTLHDPLFSRDEQLVYQVKRGDSLSGIAQRFDVSVAHLMRVNGLRKPDHLRIGQLLLVAPAEDQRLVHKVVPGENLTTIARRYGVTVDSLMQANRLSRKNMIRIGQELVVLPKSNGGKS